jgi:hypothetical protein
MATFRATSAAQLDLLFLLLWNSTRPLAPDSAQRLFVSTARLTDPSDAFTSPLSAKLATRLLARLTSSSTQPETDLLIPVLNVDVRAWFARSPHLHVHPDTGRKRARPVGGPGAGLDDWGAEKGWKVVLGAENVLRACVEGLEVRLLAFCSN